MIPVIIRTIFTSQRFDNMSMTDEQFEAYAKRIADVIAGHDTHGDGYRAEFYSKPNGEVFRRLANGSRDKLIKNLRHMLDHFVVNPLTRIDEADHGVFIEHVLAHLCGGGFEVEMEDSDGYHQSIFSQEN